MPEDASGTTIKLISGLVTASVWFLWLLASMGLSTQGSHVNKAVDVLLRSFRWAHWQRVS